MKNIFSFLYTHATGICLVIAGTIITFALKNPTEGWAIISAGLGTFGIKMATGTQAGTTPPPTESKNK